MTDTTTDEVKLPHLLHIEAEMKLLHRITGTAGAVLRRDPEWRRVARALGLLAGASADLRAKASDPATSLADEIVKAAMDGEPIALLERATSHAQRAAEHGIAGRALTDAQRSLEMDLNEAARNAVPSMFEALAGDYATLWAEIVSIQNISEVASAERAIAADRADEWTRWRELLDRNAALRQEQDLVMRRAGVPRGTSPELLFIQPPSRATTSAPTDDRGALTPGVAANEAFILWALNNGVDSLDPHARGDPDRRGEQRSPRAARTPPHPGGQTPRASPRPCPDGRRQLAERTTTMPKHNPKPSGVDRGRLRHRSLHAPNREERDQARDELKALRAKDVAPGTLVEPGSQTDNVKP